MSKAQGYIGAEAGDFNLYAKPIPKCEYHSHTKLKYCSNVINESGHKLGSQWWDTGDSLIRYRLNKSSKPL